MGLISDVEGAKLVDLEKWELGKAVLHKKGVSVLLFLLLSHLSYIENDKDGTSIYSTRDIGRAIERYEQHKFDKMIYVISSQHCRTYTGTVCQGITSNGVSLGIEYRAHQVQVRSRDEHTQRDCCFP